MLFSLTDLNIGFVDFRFVHAWRDKWCLKSAVVLQDSEAAGEQSFAEFKRQRRAEQNDVEFPDEVTHPAPLYTVRL